jgi:hypothetical protein
VLTGEMEDVAWYSGEVVRRKVQASMVGSAKGSVGVMRLPGFREDEVQGHVGWYRGSGNPGFWALGWVGWAGWVGFSELESEPGELGLLDLVQ